MTVSIEDYEGRLMQAAATPATGTVKALVARKGDGVHHTPRQAELSPEGGLSGDRWREDPKREIEEQVSLMDSRVIQALLGEDPALLHVPGDNVVVDLDLSEAALPVGTRLRVGSALLEITAKLHAGCSKFRKRLGDEALRWVNGHDRRGRRLRGVYARVVEAGLVTVGDRVVREPADQPQ